MGDKKDFVPNNNNRIEKIMDKFLTIKEVPDRNKKKQHFEKMLECSEVQMTKRILISENCRTKRLISYQLPVSEDRTM